MTRRIRDRLTTLFRSIITPDHWRNEADHWREEAVRASVDCAAAQVQLADAQCEAAAAQSDLAEVRALLALPEDAGMDAVRAELAPEGWPDGWYKDEPGWYRYPKDGNVATVRVQPLIGGGEFIEAGSPCFSDSFQSQRAATHLAATFARLDRLFPVEIKS